MTFSFLYPVIEAATFRFRGRCILGVFLLLAFTRLGHECQDLLSPFDGMHFLASRQQACVSQGRICSDKCTCCHTEVKVADQTFYLTQSQYTDNVPSSPSADPRTPGAWQCKH